MNIPLLIDVKQTQTAHLSQRIRHNDIHQKTEKYADNEKKNKIKPVK